MAEPAVRARGEPARRRRTRSRGVMAVVAVAAVPVVSLLSGCATIPDHGAVVEGGPVGADPRGPVFQVLAEGPRPGAGPEETVQGFLRAAAGFTEEHRVARSFLVPQRAAGWLPNKSVQIYPGQASLRVNAVSLDGEPVSPKPVGAAPSAPSAAATPSRSATALASEDAARAAVVEATVPVQAEIDADGLYTANLPVPQTIRFGLVRQGGQWRISTLPDGILLTSTDFDLTFRAFGVYFPDPTGSFLVPEVHWFPVTNATPTLLAKAILSGPSPWLRPAVTSGVPDGTRLTVPAVPVQAGVAVVDLNDTVLNADTVHRVMLLSQLRSTLVGVGGITDVKVTVAGAAFSMVASGAAAAHAQPDEPERRLQVDPQVDARPLVLDGLGRLARVQGGGLARRTLVGVQGTRPLAARGAVAPAGAADGSAFAVLVQGRTQLLYQLPGTPRAQTLLRGKDLTAPSFDPHGWVWSTAAACTGAVSAARPGQGRVSVRAPWLAGYRISDLKVSRDGTRALILATRNGIGRVLITGIARSKQGTPTSLTLPMRLAPDLVVTSSGAWADDDNVVVLGRTRTGGVQPWVAQVGGPASATTASTSGLPADLTTVTAGNGELDLYLGTSDGVVLTRAGASWVPIATGWWPTFAG